MPTCPNPACGHEGLPVFAGVESGPTTDGESFTDEAVYRCIRCRQVAVASDFDGDALIVEIRA
jgi:hypothetical protein